MNACLTGTSPLAGDFSGFPQGPSIDQVIAGSLAGTRRVPSLELAIRWGTGRCRGKASTLDCVNYATGPAATPIAPLLDPALIWRDLFGGDLPVGPGRTILDIVDRRY